MEYTFRGKNIYDWMITILITSLIFGYLGSFLFQPVVLLVIMFLPKLIQNAPCFKRPYNGNALLIFAILALYCTISIFWAPDFSRSIKLLIRAYIHVAFCLELMVFSQRARAPLESIAQAWILAFLLTSVVAVWELVTDHHLVAIAHEDDVLQYERHRAAVTFHNNNTYSLFVIFSLPFLMFRLITARDHKKRRRLVLALFLLFAIILVNASRGAILCLLVIPWVFARGIMKKGDKRIRRLVIVMTVLIVVFLLVLGSILLEAILYRIMTQGIFQDNARLVLMRSSWDLFLQSHGFGLGFGSMIPALTESSLNSTDLTYCHNLLLELMVEGGVLLGFAFVRFVIRLFVHARRQGSVPRKLLVYSSLLALPVFSVINSGYTSPTFVWAFFASIYIFASLPERYACPAGAGNPLSGQSLFGLRADLCRA